MSPSYQLNDKVSGRAMPYGLLDRDMQHILEAAKAFPEVTEVVLFGSRAKGTEKNVSVIDLAIKGPAVTTEAVLRFADMLNNENSLPYFFDVVNYDTINDQRLLEHINRVGVVIYQSCQGA